MLRRILTCGGALAILALSACHGGSGGGSLLPSVSNVNSPAAAKSTVRPQVVVSTNGSTSTVTGTIAGGSSSQFNVNAGSGCGYVNVSTDSSTQWSYNGLSVTAGTPVTFTGTGSCATSFTATQVTLGNSSSSSANLTGTIAGVSGNTINVNGGSGCGYVNVTYSSSTPISYNGYSLAAGTPIAVWGSGSCATSFSASSISLGTSSSSSGGSSANLTGTIAGVSGNTINVNGGSGCGYVNVTYSSSTSISYNGYSLAAGTPIAVWGSGNCSTSFSASSISLGGGSGGTSGANLTGSIVGVSGNTINVNGGSGCGYVNATYSSSTSISYNGYSLSPGTSIAVWGSGSCATSFSATSISLGGGSSSSGGTSGGGSTSMTHVLTSDYLGGYAGTHAVSASQAAPVLSWAEVNIQDANSTSGAGIKTMEYIDPFEQASSDPLYSSGGYARDCSGNVIVVPYDTSQLLMDPGSSTLANALYNWQASEESAGHIDAFFYDNTDDTWGLTTLPCGVSASTWDYENSTLIGGSNYPVVYNGYGINSDGQALINNSKVTGAMVEDAYGQRVDAGSTVPYTTGSDWVNNENLQLNAVNVGKLFFCYNSPNSDASYSIQLRNYIYASFLIGYGPSSSVLWEYFSTPSGLHVFPETELVPLNPLISSASSVSSFARGGVYVREYASCYLNGSGVGHCAAVVNSSASSSYGMPSLSQSYSHTMSISGYGILDGGSVSASGPAPPSSLAPETGVILIQ